MLPDLDSANYHILTGTAVYLTDNRCLTAFNHFKNAHQHIKLFSALSLYRSCLNIRLFARSDGWPSVCNNTGFQSCKDFILCHPRFEDRGVIINMTRRNSLSMSKIFYMQRQDVYGRP